MSRIAKDQPAAPAATVTNWLTRDAAAERCRDRGIVTVTAVTLAKLATEGRGPPYSKMGRHVFYEPAAVDAWLEEEMKPVTRGRAPAQGA